MDALQRIKDLRRALEDLREQGDSLKESLNDLQKDIEARQFIPTEEFNELTKKFIAWSKFSLTCRQLWFDLTGESLPKTFMELEKSLNAKEKQIIAQSVFGRAEKFLSFASTDSELEKDLIAHRKILTALLNKKTFNEKTKAIAEPYAKFVDMFAEPDFAKKFSMSKELAGKFSDKLIGRGIFAGMLTVSEQGTLTFTTDDNLPDNILPEVINDNSTADLQDNSVDNSQTDLQGDSDDDLQDNPPADFAKILREKDALLTEDDLAPYAEKFTVAPEPERKINSRHVREDFKIPLLGEKLHIVKELVFEPGFALDTLNLTKDLQNDRLETAVQFLYSKGYIKKYTLGDNIEFYGMSKNFFAFMSLDKSKTFEKLCSKFESKKVNFNLPKNFFDVEYLKDSLQSALPRGIFVHLRALALKSSASEFKRLFNESFFAGFKFEKNFDLFVGSFWSGTDEAEFFMSHLAKYMANNVEKINRVFVAGLNAQHAAKVLDALEAALGDNFPNAVTYVYAFDEDAFYSKDLTKKILSEEIWSTTSDDETADAETFDDEDFNNEDIDAENFDAENSDEETSDNETSDNETFDNETSAVEDFDFETFDTTPADDFAMIDEMLAAKKFYCATAYLRALNLQNENYCRQLLYALNEPQAAITYGADEIILLCNESTEPEENFLTAATLRAFFYNDKPFDYDMKTLHETVKNFALLEKNTPLAELIFALMNFKDKAHNGADYYADYRVKNRQDAEAKIARLREDARTCITRFNSNTDKAFNPRFIETKKILFGNGSELVNYLEYTTEDLFDAKIAANLRTYLTETFMKDDAPLNVANLDKNKLDNIIAQAWEEAGDFIRKKKKTNTLVGELRNNVVTSFKKAIEILCERLKVFEETAILRADVGAAEYKKVRSKLIANAKAAQKILSGEHTAGHEVLIATLQEIIDKLEGTFVDGRQKYFYADFLRGTEVLLNEDYFPILDFNTLDGTSERVTERIIAHSRADLPTFEKRIEYIFVNAKRHGDFGTAQLIDDYLKEFGDGSFIQKHKYKLQSGIDSVKKLSLVEKKNFFGDMELAQSYGQFDNAPLNTKEKILKLVDHCFEFADKTNNFGVFFRVKAYWANKTREDAKKFAASFESALELAVTNYHRKIESPDETALNHTIEHIRKMIKRQNYTVAQGLINRLSEGELHSETQPPEQTHLQRFIKDYEDYYKRVSKSGDSFQNLVDKNKRFRAKTAKAIKGGELLVDNWIPNGFPNSGDVGTDRIKKLLNLLDFDVAAVELLGAIKKDALTYKIELRRPPNGQTSNYSHPIPAFGSKAEMDGFRVTCLFGTYDADGLIERFKALGNTDDTLVFLDYALELPTRRTLARKIKAESSITKIFAVVDRVVMMYLVKNYDELQMKKMLMSLTMPFAACQPYVFNPNVPIPPEIFIGREKEMRRVLDFDDVNLVYGGRQLGKTALLKMACASLNHNENNDRAIFVDVNKCNCAAAALRVSKRLLEENFFEETFKVTDDWTELVDAIKKRLANPAPNKIPKFLLALDETDDFLKSCREEELAPVLQLIDLQQNPPEGHKFKFVMAGLRDVVRFYHDEALGNNGQIAKLPSLTVTPFDFEEANELLRKPLNYLGFHFPDNEDGDSLALMILETTNYFPGLIQLYCANLVDALSRKNYAGYSETNAPVYKISNKHVQSVLSEESFNEEIKNKINMTLRLGDDKFYYVIANLMAWRYHDDENFREGYSAEDILFTAKELGVQKFLPEDVKQVEALLKELRKLNILRETDKGKYLFVRQRFLNIIGTADEIEAEIMNNFGEN